MFPREVPTLHKACRQWHRASASCSWWAEGEAEGAFHSCSTWAAVAEVAKRQERLSAREPAPGTTLEADPKKLLFEVPPKLTCLDLKSPCPIYAMSDWDEDCRDG